MSSSTGMAAATWVSDDGATALCEEGDTDEDGCCGSAGAYNILQPELAGLLNILFTGVFPNLAAYSAPRADLAAILLTVLPEALRSMEQYRMIIYSLLLVVLMLVRPQGRFNFNYRALFTRKRPSAKAH